MQLTFLYLPALLAALIEGRFTQPNLQARSNYSPLHARQLPANVTGLKTLTTPQNVTIRYKEPGSEGVCETTPGVNSYSGYIDLDANSHTFFWFFEARNNPKDAPITLWLNGGPGSDSMIGLFQAHSVGLGKFDNQKPKADLECSSIELGPCNVTENLTSQVNPYSWNEVSNLLFLSQPLGVGFSYGSKEAGSLNPYQGDFEDASFAGVQGRYPVINASALDTTDLCAVAAWHVLQGFISGLSELDSEITSKEFNLWTESYGGHYGPVFYNYFYDQNQLIANGTNQGIQLNFNTLGIGNGIIDEYIQAPEYPNFAMNNTYGIQLYNDTVYNYAQFATYMPNGCLSQISQCRTTNRTSLTDQAICSQAQSMCRDNVEGVYYAFGDRGVYDIRHHYNDPTPPSYFIDYLNLASTQQALGVDLNYTSSNYEVFYAFQRTGDFVYPDFLEDLNEILGNGVRVALYYGDADYICNWFGGQAISLAVDYMNSAEFAEAGYAPFLVNDVEYGEVRQYGNFSFMRIYEAGHEVPYYQPEASLEMFRRTLLGLDLATGSIQFSGNYSTSGETEATHTEAVPTLTSSTSSAAATSSGTANIIIA